jgi:hypothetical protein
MMVYRIVTKIVDSAVWLKSRANVPDNLITEGREIHQIIYNQYSDHVKGQLRDE